MAHKYEEKEDEASLGDENTEADLTDDVQAKGEYIPYP